MDTDRLFRDAETQITRAAEKSAVIRVLSQWMQKGQPCVFAAYAARNDLLDFCILLEEELESGHPEKHIADAQCRWEAKAYCGMSWGFVLYLRLNNRDDRSQEELLKHSRRLAALLLGKPVDEESVATMKLYLKNPENPSTAYCWDSPVNYFSRNAAGQWWDSRKIPAGIAFSVNSVGHAVWGARITAKQAKAWSIKTMQSVDGCGYEPKENSYRCPYHPDLLLPHYFFDASGQPDEFYSLQLAERFERLDGTPYLISRDSLPPHLRIL